MSNNQYLTHEFIFFDCIFDINLLEFNELYEIFDNIYKNKLGFILSHYSNKQYNFINNINKLIKKIEKAPQLNKPDLKLTRSKFQALKPLIKAIISNNMIKQPIFLQNITFEDNHNFYLLKENQGFLEQKTILNYHPCSNDKYECNSLLKEMSNKDKCINVPLKNYFESVLKTPPRILLKSLEIQHIENIFIKILKYTSEIKIYDRYIAQNFIQNYEAENVYDDFFNTINFISNLFNRCFSNKSIDFYLYSEITRDTSEKMESLKNYIKENFSPSLDNIKYYHHLYHREASRIPHNRYIITDSHTFIIPDGSDFMTIGMKGPTDFKPSQREGSSYSISIELDKIKISPTKVIAKNIIDVTSNYQLIIHTPKR